MKSLHLDLLLRPAFEARAAAAWLLAAAWGGVLAAGLQVPAWGSAILLLALAMAAWRAAQAARVWRLKLQLTGSRTAFVEPADIVAAQAHWHDKVWLGWGWRWEPSHTQLAYEVARRDAAQVLPPAWFLRLAGAGPAGRPLRGKAWIHGLGREACIAVDKDAFIGHTGILATTGAIKTSLYKLMVYQFALQGDCVILIDPKGDRELFAAARDAATALGQPERFIALRPAFPASSVRFDGLKNWERESQVASRVRQLLPAREEDSFVQFCWTVVAHLVGCMKLQGRRPTLEVLLQHVQSLERPEALCQELLEELLPPLVADFDAALQEQLREPVRQPRAGRHGDRARAAAAARLTALLALFRALPFAQRPAPVSGLVALLEADRTWFGKMVVALVPTLTRLASLGPLLSPDYEDVLDPRPIYDMRKVVEGRRIFYVGLDALSDPSVASAIGALLTADAAGYAGETYNYGHGAAPVVHLMVDEAGDALSEPMLQNLNKGRGAGLRIYLAMQAIADIVAALGHDEVLAERVLANLNNFIIGATQDARTLEFVERRLGEVTIATRTLGQGSTLKSADLGLAFGGTRSVALHEQRVPLVPRELLAGLPDLHYLAILQRAQAWKGRIPVLQFPGPPQP